MTLKTNTLKALAAITIFLGVSGGHSALGGNVKASFQRPTQKSNVSLLAGAGFAQIGGSWGAQVRVGGEFRTSLPILLGVESGVLFGFGYIGIPILGTATYELKDFSNRTFQLRFGVSLGPIINIGRTYWWYGISEDEGSSISIAMLTRPGVQFKLTESIALNAELVIGGSLGGEFIVSPQATVAIML